jgi:hypothetical protein
MDGPSPMLTLEPDTLFEICSYVHGRDVAHLAYCCKLLATVGLIR